MGGVSQKGGLIREGSHKRGGLVREGSHEKGLGSHLKPFHCKIPFKAAKHLCLV